VDSKYFIFSEPVSPNCFVHKEYWPVKATVRVKNVVFNKDMSSEKTYDYRIFKDEYDNWKASQKGFMDELGKSLGL